MCLIEVMEWFPTQESCYEFLESIRYKDGAYCPYCASTNVARKREKARVGRWNCHDCYSSFRVTQGTVFQGTHIELQKWFLAIVLMANAKKSLSSHQLARDLKMNQKSAWFMMTRIRVEMERNNGGILQGIIEPGETFVGAKTKRVTKRDDDDSHDADKPWTKKTPVVGVAQRGGKVLAKAVTQVTSGTVLNFILDRVNTEESTLMTDENNVYKSVERFMPHQTVKHAEQCVDGEDHTNTLEGFWSLLKRAWHGQHHKYKVKFLPLYVAEACWKYNIRKRKDLFDMFVRDCFA